MSGRAPREPARVAVAVAGPAAVPGTPWAAGVCALPLAVTATGRAVSALAPVTGPDAGPTAGAGVGTVVGPEPGAATSGVAVRALPGA
ncbi:hypothetical protein ACFW6K_21680 [Streptomyces sp. NPDC058733]|uniref:hypothetical protein n=1 Tax=Streptomyces sp. NPDC058733 TaxID=3346614 RepID=UPI0036897CA1